MTEIALPLHERVAAHLRERADAIVDMWLDILSRRLRVSDMRLLPTAELRDHMPVLICRMADALLLPGYEAADDLAAHLGLVAELRREQSYPVVELLREFHLLDELVLEEVNALLAEDGDWQPASIGQLFISLHRGMMRVGMVAVETYQEAFLLEKQRIADQLAELAATLEHEIRGPLQAATTSVELLRDESVAHNPERRDRYTSVIRERLQRVGQVISDVRELSVAERAFTREDRKPVRSVIQDVMAELGSFAKDAGVTIKIVEPLAEIRVDPARVEVALMNLVSNAIKYSDPSKPERWVEVSLLTDRDSGSPRWYLRVEDNGLGVPAGLHKQVFHRRVRVHPDVAEGTGLGLSIVKEIMEQRGGAIHFESKEGEGSCFVLELTPRLAEPDARSEAGKDESAERDDQPSNAHR